MTVPFALGFRMLRDVILLEDTETRRIKTKWIFCLKIDESYLSCPHTQGYASKQGEYVTLLR